jgi:hypothetical protein
MLNENSLISGTEINKIMKVMRQPNFIKIKIPLPEGVCPLLTCGYICSDYHTYVLYLFLPQTEVLKYPTKNSSLCVNFGPLPIEHHLRYLYSYCFEYQSNKH